MSCRFITVISWSWSVVRAWDASSRSLRITPAAKFDLIALVLFSEGRRRSEVCFRHKTAASFSRWLEGKKKERRLPSVRLRENTTSLFVANQSMAVYWYEIGLRCLVDLSDCCYCQPHPNTIFIFIFFSSPPSTSNLCAIWSSHRLAARNKPGWWKQVDPGRASVWRTTVMSESGWVPVSFFSPGHAYYSVVTVLSLVMLFFLSAVLWPGWMIHSVALWPSQESAILSPSIVFGSTVTSSFFVQVSM